MIRFVFVAAIALASPLTAQVSKQYRSPDFSGRDKSFSYMRSRIMEGLRSGPNFSNNYTIIRTGCGTGCTSNYIVDRRTGKVFNIPWGGEIYNMLNLRFNLKSNQITAAWFDGDMCTSQTGRWNGSAFELTSSPRGRPNSFCEG